MLSHMLLRVPSVHMVVPNVFADTPGEFPVATTF